MNVLQKLTLANLKHNKRRTIVTVIGALLSTALILAVVGMVTSLQKMMINFAIDGYGNYHEMFQEVPADALKYIEENKHVESYYFSAPLDPSTVPDDKMETYQDYQHSPYSTEHYQKLTELPANATGKYNIFVRYRDPKNYQDIRQNIRDTLASTTGSEINYRTNSDMLRYEAMVMGDASLTALYSIAAIVIAIIIITSIFVIRNSFSISASERARQFGMLSSVGATPQQIRRSILFEGLVIAGFGIPLGILLGVTAVAILVLVMNVLLDGMTPVPVEFSMPLWIFPVTIILSLVTILLSSLLPAIRTAKIPPIEAIRGNNDIKIKAKKLRTPKMVNQAFGVGGVIAYKNLKRSRKKYRTTVVSLVLSVATFVGLSSFLSYGLDMVGTEYSNENIDFIMQGGTADFYHELQARFNLAESTYYLTHMSSYEASAIAMEASSFEQFAKSVGVNAKDYSKVVLFNDYGMNMRDDGSFELSRITDLKDGDDYKVKIVPEVPKKCEYQTKHEGTDGEEYYLTDYDKTCLKAEDALEREVSFHITKMINERPLGFGQSRFPMVIVSENYEHIDDLRFSDLSYREFYAAHVDDVKPITEYVDRWIETEKPSGYVFYRDIKENASEMYRMYFLMAIFLYGFIIVVTLIGVTNIFNTITTNIALRAKEFAILKSIGMTSKEFNHMVRLESLMYSGKALLIGLPLGLLISYGFYMAYANMVDFGYHLPWSAIAIAVLAVGILVGLIMRYSVKQVEKQNIIETIRSENV